MDSLLDRLQIETPIIAAPMAGVSTPELAAAASNAGALGSLGVGAMDAQGAQQMIAAFRELSTRSLHINVFCHAPARADRAREARWLERLQPEFARVGATPPNGLREIYRSFVDDEAMLQLRALRDAGIVLLAAATSLAEARLAAAAGFDAIIAQGYEAGGHRGVFDPDAPDDQLGTLALTRTLVRAIDRPIIAAGGIMDGAGIAAALHLGASAAQLGTAFIACPESQADAGYRATLASEAAHHTVITRAISGRPARCLPNRFTTLGRDAAPADIPDYPIAYDAGKQLHQAAKAKQDYGYGAQWAGQGAPLSRPLSAADLVALLRRELAEAGAAAPANRRRLHAT
jgi:nitronate monooxygenase